MRQAYELLLLCYGKASNVKDKKNKQTKTHKQTDKPNQKKRKYTNERPKKTMHTLNKIW